jgi:ribose transport system ATP-binding protein
LTDKLRLESISKSFGATRALVDVSLSASSGEVLALVGENGSGKSTLMRILAGEEPPDKGSMFLDGSPYTPRDPTEAHRHGVALIHQELALCEHLTVAENIVLGNEPRQGPVLGVAKIRELAARLLAEMGYPNQSPGEEVRRLSPATKQVVEIAKALARNAGVVIFDEPTSSLGKHDVDNLFTQIRALRERGVAVIYISHFLDEVMEIADRAIVLRDGAAVGSFTIRSTSVPELVKSMVGREVVDLYPRSSHLPGDALLTLNHLVGLNLPRGCNAQIMKGEVFGIAGLNGSGRTEVLRAIFGLAPVVSGEIKFAAYSGAADPHDRWSQGMGFLSEDRKLEGLALGLSLAENLLMPKPGRTGLVSPKAQTAKTSQWIEKLGIRCKDPDQPVRELSGGNQQKIALARLLEHDVDLLLLDEPTRGIDLGSKAEIYKVIDALALQGKAVLLVSSYLPELLGVCDRIAVMARGVLSPPVKASETDAERLMEACVQ